MLRISFVFLLFFSLSLAAVAQVPASTHVFLVVEENHGYSSVIGNSAMPYLNSLASKYGLATRYYANTHPSIGNYFMLTAGQIITNNDSFNSTVTADNLVRRLLSAGKTWKSYAEGLPSTGYTGWDVYPYVKHHNPFAYFSDVVNSSNQKGGLVPFTRFSADLANNQLPNFSFIVPNLLNDAHNGTLNQADIWLQKNIAPLIASATFQKDGILVILFDESTTADTAYGGGHVAMVVVGPKAKRGYRSGTLYKHQSTLKMLSKALGLSSFPGAASTAPDMGEFFGASTTTSGVTVTLPLNGATMGSPVHTVASAKSTLPITAMKVYVDGRVAYSVLAASLNAYLNLGAGAHTMIVQAWDTGGTVFKNTLNISVQ